MKKLLVVFGTRPEAIKMIPLVHSLRKCNYLVKICVTGQHREMLDQVLDFFDVKPDYDLDVMSRGQSLTGLTAKILTRFEVVLDEYMPDLIFVHGDTTTAMSITLSAFYRNIKIAHVEAGLRTGNLKSPFPEEMNRQVISRMANIHFAPTKGAEENLINEGIDTQLIHVTGNTVIDALFYSIGRIGDKPLPKVQDLNVILDQKDVILVTGHRRENHGMGLNRICEALSRISVLYPDVKIVYPVHLNPAVKNLVELKLGNIENIILVSPMGYPEFVWLMNRSKIILTDSGGIQEEAPSLGKPVLVMRENTERPEAVEAGTAILVGTSPDKIVEEVSSLIDDKFKYESISAIENPYGDGKASERIVAMLNSFF
jgi:UDP-N-acetylglucosamine 2-epimerase (non-hydrolysing)